MTDISYFQTQDRDVDSDSGGKGNVILYIGLCMMAVGLVITFVGLGDKGFKTLELKLIGPSLVGCGMFFALLRILYCTVPACGKTCCGRIKESDKLLVEKQNKANLDRNILRNVVNNPDTNIDNSHLSQALDRPTVIHQHNFRPESNEEEKDRLRPRLSNTA